jgi:hypothetical protein
MTLSSIISKRSRDKTLTKLQQSHLEVGSKKTRRERKRESADIQGEPMRKKSQEKSSLGL